MCLHLLHSHSQLIYYLAFLGDGYAPFHSCINLPDIILLDKNMCSIVKLLNHI